MRKEKLDPTILVQHWAYSSQYQMRKLSIGRLRPVQNPLIQIRELYVPYIASGFPSLPGPGGAGMDPREIDIQSCFSAQNVNTNLEPDT